ncbi:hypothetical protein DPMN_058741 [Dreissena polymorpha]|uniref:Uncharacterized protein n=1 Tax=Dreissena polymorpha TaxID=45954 RepID=A0A9D4C2M7_DREPO|nr:hypothetical protein DPMN_058741 [Dreissena polymorpha]
MDPLTCTAGMYNTGRVQTEGPTSSDQTGRTHSRALQVCATLVEFRPRVLRGQTKLDGPTIVHCRYVQ